VYFAARALVPKELLSVPARARAVHRRAPARDGARAAVRASYRF